jgi:membrane peptidoglycan carboxypeptidase
MPSPLTLIRQRRQRRETTRRSAESRVQRFGYGLGFGLSILLAAGILAAGLFYADLTRDLPPITQLPALLNARDGQLLQPTRFYDRSGDHLLLSLSPTDETRRYLPLEASDGRHLPIELAQATVALADPGFWQHAGYLTDGWNRPDEHPTIAQKLVSDLLLWDEPPSTRRAIRERILAAQITARYGREQVLEWYLNSADYGHYAYGADAAARFYFGKPASGLDMDEAASLAAASQAPALNPLDAPLAAYQRGQEAVQVLLALGQITAQQAEAAYGTLPLLPSGDGTKDNIAPAFLNIVISQVETAIPRERLVRGGLTVITTLDYDLQLQADCAVLAQAARLNGRDPGQAGDCDAARLLPALPPGFSAPGAAASAVVLDPLTGQVLALVGDTGPEGQSAYLTEHRSGSALDPFVYLTGFTRGLGPASLVWDIPDESGIQNFDGKFHGPLRLRVALANDYLVPAAGILDQMGRENVLRTVQSFGLTIPADADLLGDGAPLTPLDLAGAYGAFASGGQAAGQPTNETFGPATVLRVEATDHATRLDWTVPQTRPVLSEQLAYLMNNVLSDEPARWPSLGYPNPLEIGRPAGARTAQTPDGLDTWTLGYTPLRAVVVWTGATGGSLPARVTAGLWNALIQTASRDLASPGWTMPGGVTTLQVCDPSGLLPTAECPNVVNEVFLSGNEPGQFDTLYRTYLVNRETGFLATVFTPPQMVEERVYLVVPPEARSWARSAGVDVPPDSYDAIQEPAFSANARIVEPDMFADVRGKVLITGAATGADFSYYRIQVGQGLNPQEWIQVEADHDSAVAGGVLAEWDTSGLNGLYAVQLLVVHKDQTVEITTIQVTVDNQAPTVDVLYPADGAEIRLAGNARLAFQLQAGDNMALDRLELFVDGAPLNVLRQAPFVAVWDTTRGRHTLRVVAYDRAGNETVKEVEFVVK